ncbi:MAG: Tat pathway signal protein, partial [Eggerthellaceae bacterium]|nr:Tat pathway signal protein [Eggerthellaceae bacterium]
NEKGMIWTEANIFSNIWRVYTATYEGYEMGEVLQLDEGDGDWETPTIAAVGSHAFWQVLPRLGGAKIQEKSLLKRAGFGKRTSDIIFTSVGRMCTPIYALKDSLVITPRTNTDSVHHQMTLLDAITGETKDKLVLPPSMRPLEAGWGKHGFIFCFDGGYDYGGGIAHLGTYTPQTTVNPDDYAGKAWFHFNRYPTAPSCWCRDLFIVKSMYSIYGIDHAKKQYFIIDIESGSDTYGDYLATTGMTGSFVAFSNIHSRSIDGTIRKCCLVRVWAPYV